MSWSVWAGVGLMIGSSCFAQELRQGSVFEPEEGKADLALRAKEYDSREVWEEKAAKIRQGILEGAELWPLPEKSPLNPIRHSVKKMDGYQVENVAIESLPGLFVTGNLYLPDKREKMPLVLCPHGHWQGDDLAEHGRFREDMQKRCGVLARMGCAVFAFDGIGFGESMKLGWEHKFKGPVLKMQLWNAIRVLDFMWGLEGADHSRVLVTGASGGGTLTIQLAAVDERVSMSVPCAMVSSYFYGGCNCESGMPIHVRPGHVTNPVEIAGVIAPKPMLLISDGGDWTAQTPEDVFPHLKRIYGFYSKSDQIENAHFPEGKHDYGKEKREALYDFVVRKWELDGRRADEGLIGFIKADDLLVFDDEHPVSANAVEPNKTPDFRSESSSE